MELAPLKQGSAQPQGAVLIQQQELVQVLLSLLVLVQVSLLVLVLVLVLARVPAPLQAA